VRQVQIPKAGKPGEFRTLGIPTIYGRVLRLIEAMLKAGSYGKGRLFPTERGTPQGGVVSPLLSNILLSPFDQEMRRKGYQLTRYADDCAPRAQRAEEGPMCVTA
jgi:retron-type reverse transcriptase